MPPSSQVETIYSFLSTAEDREGKSGLIDLLDRGADLQTPRGLQGGLFEGYDRHVP